MTNCTFIANSGLGGGGMSHSDSTATVTNCTFSGNSAINGGGMLNSDSSPTVTNCTFSENFAVSRGGGMVNVNGSRPLVTNCILWGNRDSTGMGQTGQIRTFTGTPVVDYSIVQGGWSGAGGIGVLDADPLFVDADGPDDTPGTEDDDLRLMPGSPAIDSADTTALPPDVADLDGDGDATERTPLDLAGNPRVLNDPATPDTGIPGSRVVDMGAYEFAPDCNANGLADECDVNCLGGKGTCNVPGCGQSSDSDANDIPDECETGACCDGTTGLCADDVPMTACSGGQRHWSLNTLCAELDPPCAAAIPTVNAWGWRCSAWSC
jgi:hypothetical protein